MRVIRVPRALALGFVLGLVGCGAGAAGTAPSPMPQRAVSSPMPAEVKPYVPVVRGGAYCGSAGDYGVTKKGTRMECAKAKDGELRWVKAKP